MSKKLFAVGITLFFLFSLSSGVFAQIGDYYGLESMLISDWQLDYIRPIDPDELEKGEFRFAPIIGRVNNDYERNDLNGDYSYDYDNNTMAYMLVFDSKFTEKLSLHSKFIYQPWEDYSYTNFSNDSFESRSTLTDLFLNYEMKEDKILFFGYNRALSKRKEYDSDNILEDEEEDTNNIYYLGLEIRGSFSGGKE